MPVYQDRGPGLGQGISDAIDAFIQTKRQKRFDAMAQTQAADAHAGAQSSLEDADIARRINYGFLDPGVQVTGDGSSTPAPRAAPPGGAGPDDFTANLTSAFNGVPGMSPGSAPADGGRPLPVNPRNAVGQQLVQAMAQRRSAPPAAPTSNDPSGDFQANLASTYAGGGAGGAGGAPPTAAGLPSYPHQRITLGNGATIDPMAGFQREAYKQTLLSGIKTDADIRTAVATGVVNKNEADAAKARHDAQALNSGDGQAYVDMQGKVAGAEAAAKLPADLALAVRKGQIDLNTALATVAARGNVEAGLQTNQQGFTAGQNALNRTFETGQQRRELEGNFLNASALANQNHRSSVLGRVTAADAQTTAPSDVASDLATQREAWDNAAAALRAQKKDPDTVLPPRP